MLLIGHAINFDVDNVKIAVYDKCNDNTSRAFTSAFVNSGYFKLKKVIYNEREITPLLDKGSVSAVIIIPSDYTKKLKRGYESPIQILVDASDNYTASIISGYTLAIVNRLSGEVVKEYINRKGKLYLMQTFPVTAEIRIFFNPMLKSKYSAVPGLVAFIMVIISTFLISMTIAKEWEQGTIEQLFASPLKGYEIIAGKFLFYFCLTIIQCIILGLFARYYFDVPFKSNLLSFFILSCAFLTGTVGLGLVISIVSKSLFVAVQIATMISMLPTLLMSGFIYSIKSMPDVLQPFAKILPATYYIDALRKLFLKGTPLAFLLRHIAILLIMGIITSILCIIKFKKRLSR
jgi:ABC-2 type transport system permease protein